MEKSKETALGEGGQIDLFDAIKQKCAEDFHDGDKYLKAAITMLSNLIGDLPGFEYSIKKCCDSNLKDVSEFGGFEGVLLRGCELGYFEMTEFVKILTDAKALAESTPSGPKPKI